MGAQPYSGQGWTDDHGGMLDNRAVAIRVVIADDHPVVRRGLAALITSIDGFDVVGEAADGAAAVRETQLPHPDAVIMDISMPGVDGLEATRRIVAAVPDVAVLVLTMHDDDDTVFAAMQAGARGYLLKGADQDDIAHALRAVVAGQAIFGPGVARRVWLPVLHPELGGPGVPELTAREREVLDMIARGSSNGPSPPAAPVAEDRREPHLIDLRQAGGREPGRGDRPRAPGRAGRRMRRLGVVLLGLFVLAACASLLVQSAPWGLDRRFVAVLVAVGWSAAGVMCLRTARLFSVLSIATGACAALCALIGAGWLAPVELGERIGIVTVVALLPAAAVCFPTGSIRPIQVGALPVLGAFGIVGAVWGTSQCSSRPPA